MTIHERGGSTALSSHRHRRLATLIAISLVATLLGAPVASAAPVEITDAVFEWGVSAEMQKAPPFGGCNFLTAGASDGTQATYSTSQGDVEILKNGAAPTWATKCDGAAAGTMNQKLVWSGGTGTVDTETGEATIAFSGQVSVAFYGGLVPFTIEDPVLTVAADGSGQVVATVFGWASSMDDPFVKVPLDPEEGVVVADLSNVEVGAGGITIVPDYEGVE